MGGSCGGLFGSLRLELALRLFSHLEFGGFGVRNAVLLLPFGAPILKPDFYLERDIIQKKMCERIGVNTLYGDDDNG